MAAGVVSGAVALLLRGAADAEAGECEGGAAADEFVRAERPGLLGAGAGSVNVLAAAVLVAAPAISRFRYRDLRSTDQREEVLHSAI